MIHEQPTQVSLCSICCLISSSDECLDCKQTSSLQTSNPVRNASWSSSKTYCFHSFASRAAEVSTYQLIEVSSLNTSFLVTRHFTKRTSSANRSEGQQPSTGGSNEQQVVGISSTSTAGAWEEHLSTEITWTVLVHRDSFVWCKLGSIHVNCQQNYGGG